MELSRIQTKNIIICAVAAEYEKKVDSRVLTAPFVVGESICGLGIPLRPNNFTYGRLVKTNWFTADETSVGSGRRATLWSKNPLLSPNNFT